MYFAVLWKNPEISMAELELVQAKEISYPKNGIVIFDTKYGELLPQLWWCIKIGKVVKEKQLQELLSDTKIVGIQNEANGKHLKRTVGIRRYKLVDTFHTDKEIKNKGTEVINLENGRYGIVEQYQNIELYEAVDFGKPWRSMQMWMMPAKLAHIMINIWLSTLLRDTNKQETDDQQHICIYDPFVGSGTTGFLANYLGYDFIGSDIKIDFAEQNAPRRKTTKFYTPNKQFDIFQHDIKEQVNTPLIRGQESTDMVIITEWRLWPIVTKTTSSEDIQRFQEQVALLYKTFIDRIKELAAAHKSTTAVFTIPYYARQENSLEKEITDYTKKIGLHIKEIPEIYGREGQQVGRKILIITA